MSTQNTSGLNINDSDIQQKIIENTLIIAAKAHASPTEKGKGDLAVKEALGNGTFPEMLKKIEEDLIAQNNPAENRDKIKYLQAYRHLNENKESPLNETQIKEKTAESYGKLSAPDYKQEPAKRNNTINIANDLLKKGNDDLTIDNIKTILAAGDLTIENATALNDLLVEKSKGGKKSPTEGSAEGKPQKGIVEDRDIDPIKEGDIITYMLNDWVYKLADHGIKKGFRELDEIIEWADRWAIDKLHELKENVDHETPTLLKKAEDMFRKDLADNKTNQYDGTTWRTTSEAVYNGNFEKLPISDESYEFLKAMSDDDRKKHFDPERTEKNIKAMNDINRRVLDTSSLYAIAQIYDKQASGKLNMQENEDLATLYKREKAAATRKIYKWLDKEMNGKEPNDAVLEQIFDKMQNMNASAFNAYTEASNQVNKGHYKDNNNPKKPYVTPKSLEELNKSFPNLDQEKVGLLEAAVLNNSVDATLQQTLRKTDNNFKDHEGKEIALNNRKERNYKTNYDVNKQRSDKSSELDFVKYAQDQKQRA